MFFFRIYKNGNMKYSQFDAHNLTTLSQPSNVYLKDENSLFPKTDKTSKNL